MKKEILEYIIIEVMESDILEVETLEVFEKLEETGFIEDEEDETEYEKAFEKLFQETLEEHYLKTFGRGWRKLVQRA